MALYIRIPTSRLFTKERGSDQASTLTPHGPHNSFTVLGAQWLLKEIHLLTSPREVDSRVFQFDFSQWFGALGVLVVEEHARVEYKVAELPVLPLASQFVQVADFLNERCRRCVCVCVGIIAINSVADIELFIKKKI